MQAHKVEDAASTRMMDAAVLLLDASRSVAAEGPNAGKATIITDVITLAVQAIFMADHWDSRDRTTPNYYTAVNADEVLNRIRGLGSGMACCIASMPDPAVLRDTVPTYLLGFNNQLSARLGQSAPRLGVIR